MPKPSPNETHDEYISRCMSDPDEIARSEDQDARYARCEGIWQSEKNMTQPDLLQRMSNRKSSGPFGYGITTADKYVREVVDCLGKPYCENKDAIIKAASLKLVYATPQMILEQCATSPLGFKEILPAGVELPEHTGMINVHTLTTPAEDRDGDTLRTEGAILDPKAPSLWQHLHTFPVGKILSKVLHTKDRLRVASVILDINDLTSDVMKLVEANVLRFSHGFIAKEWTEKKASDGNTLLGFDVTKFEILEESYVSVPSNFESEIELWSRGKLASDVMKAHAKAKFDARTKVFRGASFDGQATKADADQGQRASVAQKTAGWSGAHLDELCQFAKTLQETEAMAPGEALAKSVEKIEQQRKLIDSVQLQGSHYSPRRSRSKSEQETGGVPLVATQPPETATPAAAIPDEKAGRMLSAANIATLKEVRDDLTELAGMEITRSAKALVERCARKLDDLLKTAVGEEAATMTAKEVVATIKDVVANLKPDLQAVVEFVLACTEPERQKVLHTLMTLLRVERMDELAEQYRTLIQA